MNKSLFGKSRIEPAVTLPKRRSRPEDDPTKSANEIIPAETILEILPKEIQQIICLVYCGEYIPLIREVCRMWRDIVADEESRVGLEKLSNMILPSHTIALRGHLLLLKWIRERNPFQPNIMMARAAPGGHLQVVQVCKAEWSATNLNEAMVQAARRGHEEIVKLRKEWGATDFNSTILEAAERGQIEIVRLCKAWGANWYNLAMLAAAAGGHVDIVREFKDYDVVRFDAAMAQAARRTMYRMEVTEK